MEKIITDIYGIMKHSSNPIETEKKIQNYMWDTFSEIMGEILEKINQTIKEKNKRSGGKSNAMIRERFNVCLVRFNLIGH